MMITIKITTTDGPYLAVWLDDHCIAYGLEPREARLIEQAAALALDHAKVPYQTEGQYLIVNGEPLHIVDNLNQLEKNYSVADLGMTPRGLL